MSSAGQYRHMGTFKIIAGAFFEISGHSINLVEM